MIASGRGAWPSVAAASCVLLAGCDPLDLCPPNQWRAGFLSQGDCVLTRSESFGGHEWLTDFANLDLAEDGEDRFTDAEIDTVIEGNRRVDFPKELLVHLNQSVLAYADALAAYHDAPENQPKHFLLDDKNTTPEAAEAARELVLERSVDAASMWAEDRVGALTRIGQACHALQDSFSAAHSVRDVDDARWCVRKVKAYMPRAAGFLTPDIEFHGGGDNDTIGHITPQDSIYREGRDCREPSGREAIEACLSDHAMRARAATRAYLAAMLAAIRSDRSRAAVTAEVMPVIDAQMALCDQGD